MRGMQTAFTRSLAEMEREKYDAPSTEVAEMADRAWTQTMVAERHAMLVNKFMWMADAERQLASRFAATPGRMTLAEATRVRASRYQDTAERHRQSAREHAEEGARFASEVRSMTNGGRGRSARPQSAPANPGNPQPPPRQRPQPAQGQMARAPESNGSASQ